MSDDTEEHYRANISVGGTNLEISSHDEEWVDKKFDKVFDRMVEEDLIDGDNKFYVNAGAGSMAANAVGRTPQEAMEYWYEMWNEMLEDIEDMSAKERERAGLSRQQ